MITARSAYQIYKHLGGNSSISTFNSLPSEASLPYKIQAAEEAILALLELMESSSEVENFHHLVSILHAANSYLSLVASYAPLLVRSQSLKRLSVNYDALARMANLFTGEAASSLAPLVNQLVVANASMEKISMRVISDLESCIRSLEKNFRQKAKNTGQKIVILRKKSSEPSSLLKNSPLRLSQGDNGLSTAEGVEAKAAADVSFPESLEKTEVQDARPLNESCGTNGASRSKSALTISTRKRAARSTSSTTTTALVARKAAMSNDDEEEASARLLKSELTLNGNATTERNSVRPETTVPRLPLILSRLRTLTSGEKKVVTALNEIIRILGHVYANKFKDLILIFDHLEERLKAIQAMIAAELEAYNAKNNTKNPQPFYGVELDTLKDALAASMHTFREDHECRYELDEDLLHPIAYACLKVINQIEGYETAPFHGPTKEDLEKKQAARDAAKAKREEMERKLIERARAKEELENKKEKEKQLLRQRLGGFISVEDLQEDTELKNPVPSAFVQYHPTLPLKSVENFEKALFVWAMLVSVPRILFLSQMPFSLFLKALQLNSQDANGLMEEITRCLLEVAMEHFRTSMPNTPRILTRGKNWFDILVEFVGVASGNKKRQQQSRPEQPFSDDDHEDDDNDDDEDDDNNSTTSSASGSSTSTSNASAKEDLNKRVKMTAAHLPVEEELSVFDKELRATMDRILGLRSLATWGNVTEGDRLNLLMFSVQEALNSDKVRGEADRLMKEQEERRSTLERRLREIQEEAGREMKSLLKQLDTSSTGASPAAATENIDEKNTSYEIQKAKLLSILEKKRHDAYMEFYHAQDSNDRGAIIEPLGMDRYRRLYWRFPLEREVRVQTIGATNTDFPLLPEPEEIIAKKQAHLLLDSEEEEIDVTCRLRHRRRLLQREEPRSDKEVSEDKQERVQRRWGSIPAEYLPSFCKGLDMRGEREAPLRKALEEITPYLQSLEKQLHEGCMTRARAHMLTFKNKLSTLY